jgi:cytochrome c
LLGALAGMALCPGAARAQDAAPGEKAFAQCRVCHQIGPNARNAIGPELNGLAGRQAGSVAGYAYSAANRQSGIVWDEATFLRYIENPQAVVKGTKMTFAGIRNPQQAKDLWAFLAQFDAAGQKTP